MMLDFLMAHDMMGEISDTKICIRSIHQYERDTYLESVGGVANMSYLRRLLAKQVSLDDEGCK